MCASVRPTDLVEISDDQETILFERTALVAAIFKDAQDAIIVEDLDGFIISWNSGAERIFGYSWEEVKGKHISMLAEPDSRIEVSALYQKASRAELIEPIEAVRVCKDGHRINVSVSISAIRDDAGKLAGILTISRDVSQRKQAEAELQQMNEDLNRRLRERNQELDQANQELLLEIENRQQAYYAEQQARQSAEVLHSAGLALTRSLDLKVLMKSLLEYTQRLAPYDIANVALLEKPNSLQIHTVRENNHWVEFDEKHQSVTEFRESSFLNQIFNTQNSVCITDTTNIPEGSLNSYNTAMHNWLGVPLIASGKVIGLLTLEKREPGFFSSEHVRLVEALVSLAAVIIQNAWLFEQVRSGRQRLQAISRRLVEIQESERRYIARELHDEASQSLTSLIVGLALLEHDANNPKAVLTGITELKQLVEGVQENLHRLAIDLRPASLDHLGLVAALEQYIEAFSNKHDLTIHYEVAGVTERLPLDVETALYRIVQEGLTNVVRHAHATQADVILERRDANLLLILEDNGVGFDVHDVRTEERLGLYGIQERAEMLRGSLVVDSLPGSGTTLVVEIPYDFTNLDRR